MNLTQKAWVNFVKFKSRLYGYHVPQPSYLYACLEILYYKKTSHLRFPLMIRMLLAFDMKML